MMADALRANGLTELKGPMTVFVSPNSAYTASKVTTKMSLLNHFVTQTLSSNAIENDMVIPSASGQLLRFNLYYGQVPRSL